MAWFKFGKNKSKPSKEDNPKGLDEQTEDQSEEIVNPDDQPQPDTNQDDVIEQIVESKPQPEPELISEVKVEAWSEEDTELSEEITDEEDNSTETTKRHGLFSRFKERLVKTRSSLSGRLEAVFTGGGDVDEDTLEGMEEILITSDLGVDATTALLEKLRKAIRWRNLTNPADLQDVLKNSMLELLDVKSDSLSPTTGPEVILIVGVNGVGKTTTIGKLANRYVNDGKKVLLAAGDTFRAAAGQQLNLWADRVGADIVRHKEGADPSAVVFDALDAAVARDTDIVIVDTAGRLHTQVNLMKELQKIRRVMSKKIPDAPHQTILILDATTGQNALSQAKLFNEATPLSGLIMTKLDGTAKGGIVAAVTHRLQKPILYVGLGEQMDDLRTFDPEAFVEAIL